MQEGSLHEGGALRRGCEVAGSSDGRDGWGQTGSQRAAMWDPRRLLACWHKYNNDESIRDLQFFRKKKKKHNDLLKRFRLSNSSVFLSVLFLLSTTGIFISHFLCSISFAFTMVEHSGDDTASGKEESNDATCWIAGVQWRRG